MCEARKRAVFVMLADLHLVGRSLDCSDGRTCVEARDMREHVLLFCLLGLVLTATIILVTP